MKGAILAIVCFISLPAHAGGSTDWGAVISGLIEVGVQVHDYYGGRECEGEGCVVDTNAPSSETILSTDGDGTVVDGETVYAD